MRRRVVRVATVSLTLLCALSLPAGAQTPDPLYGVGMWYEDFSQTTDDEVRNLLARSR